MATLTYVYAESTAVVGPLASMAEPHSYDLCEHHALSLTAPRGWKLVRDEVLYEVPAVTDDLVALAEAVREPVRQPSTRPVVRTVRRGHLRVLPPPAR